MFNFKGLRNVILPDHGKKYRFSAHHALEKAPFTCFYDTEASVNKTNSGIKGTTHEHKIISYGYVIIDKKQK